MLIERAFDLKWYQTNGPDWLKSDRFDITARIPEGATRPQFQQMLQDLLARRFKLAATRVRKEIPVYQLRVVKDTHKLTEWVDPPDGSRPPASGMFDAPGGGIIRRMAGWPMETIVAWLEITVERPIIDETGLKARYDLSVRYFPHPSDTDAGPDLIEALRSQLGLSLDPAKRMMDVLTVDHIERTPTEN